MAVETLVLRSQRVSCEEETTEGTAVAETADGAMLMDTAGATFRLERDIIESALMSGSFSEVTPTPGMWNVGVTLPTKMRGIGTLTTNGPDFQMPLKSLFGTEYRAEAGVVNAGATALTIPVKSGCASPIIVAGQLLYFPTQGEVRQIASYAAPNIVLETPLKSIPAEDDLIKTGVNWMLTSAPKHPIYTTYGYFGATWGKRVYIKSCKTESLALTMTVGGLCDMVFVARGLAPDPPYDNTAQAITPTYDQTTVPLTCLDVLGWDKVAGTATGVPTQTQTILLAPNYDVRIGDTIFIEVSAGVWEDALISNVSGSAPGNLTLTHASVSIAASATDTVYILRSPCADTGETLTVNVSCPLVDERCMFNATGLTGLTNVSRQITIESEPRFQSWEQFLMRDNSVGMSMLAVLGDTLNNMVAMYIPKRVNASVTLNNNDVMTQSVSARAVKPATLGDEYEMVIAAF